MFITYLRLSGTVTALDLYKEHTIQSTNFTDVIMNRKRILLYIRVFLNICSFFNVFFICAWYCVCVPMTCVRIKDQSIIQ